MSKVIGTSVNRHEGRAKVTGTATYGAEHQISELVYGYLIVATIANGRIKKMELKEAQDSDGVLAIFTHENMPAFPKANEGTSFHIGEPRLPLADDRIHYGGQIIGLVVADTLERACHAASLVKVEYEIETPTIDRQQASFQKSPRDASFEQGNVADALVTAPVKISATYTTPRQLHAMMEPHPIIAQWHDRNSLTVCEPTQWLFLQQRTYATLFGIPVEQVRVISPYIGGGFGAKAWPWPHAILCIAAAREINRPLKVVVSRQQMAAIVGHRSPTEQTIELGASQSGQLIAIAHAAKSYTSPVNPKYVENCIGVTPTMYAAPNLCVEQEIAVVNVGMPTFMRAPGENPGMYALESAMDELAWALQIDPIELRLKNATTEHQRKKLPFSSKHFAECLKLGAEQFRWCDRPMQTKAISRDDKLVGWGMAAATFPAIRMGASATVRLLLDGTAQVLTAANDMGTGSYTVVAIAAAETLDLPVYKIKVEIGDSRFPNGGLAGGSMMTASLAPAVVNACQLLLQEVNAKNATEAVIALRESGRPFLEMTASSQPGEEGKQWAFQSWGAHFCEVEVDELLGRVQVKRWISVMDVGRAMNAKAAASQIRGGVIMGIGEALMEECLHDLNLGLPVIKDLATYHIPVNADIPRIEVSFVGKPDLNFNPLGVRGCGEIAITGVSAAIANAVYHATGKRIRNLPITADKLLL
ncbi:xanthine dehydrogenase family protein molybdopterin-binding subunit [Aerosakkonema sp. BLCC-F183]|uniref:xanthine dehydrogenase family protein molybdopterin-binding subunit n=1 Tax=Aerosakkonema sp. BLCC-F183 TaxID=3342834 RepID=UPI0035B77F98